MFLKSRYDRAKKWQLEQKAKMEANNEYNGEKLHEETIADILEKGDMFALMLSGFLTIWPIVTILLLIMVLIGYLFMRLI